MFVTVSPVFSHISVISLLSARASGLASASPHVGSESGMGPSAIRVRRGLYVASPASRRSDVRGGLRELHRLPPPPGSRAGHAPMAPSWPCTPQSPPGVIYEPRCNRIHPIEAPRQTPSHLRSRPAALRQSVSQEARCVSIWYICVTNGSEKSDGSEVRALEGA